MITAKKLTAAVLLTALSSTLIVTPVSASTFDDVTKDHWAYKDIIKISNDDIMSGYQDGTFAPDRILTYAEYASVLYNLLPEYELNQEEKDTKSAQDTFYYDPYLSLYLSSDSQAGYNNDAGETMWYDVTMKWALQNAIITDDGLGINPDGNLSREAMGDMTYNFLEKYATQKLSTNDEHIFNDDDQFRSETVKEKIHVLANIGILGGTEEGSFNPSGNFTRAEAAAVAVRLQEVLDASYSDDYYKKKAEKVLKDGNAKLSTDDRELVDIVNRARHVAGKDELNVSPLLTKAAEERAKEIVEKGSDLDSIAFYGIDGNYFSYRPSGASGLTAIREQIADDAIVTYAHLNCGENLVRKYGSGIMTPAAAFEALSGSEEHRANMMDEDYEYIGVAYYNNGICSAWVQIFGYAR